MADGMELGIAGVQKALAQQLDNFLRQRKVSNEAREAIVNSFEMMVEYIPYALKQKKDPSDGKVLAAFLATKGQYLAKYLGNDSLNCGLAIVDLLKSGTRAAEASAGAGAVALPVPVLAWGLAGLDLIAVGNSCEFAQRAYYEAFLKDSDHVIRRSEAAPGVVAPLP